MVTARAVEVHEAGRLAEAAEVRADAIGDQPGDPDTLLPSAEQMRNLGSTLSPVDQAIDGNRSSPSLFMGYGTILQRQGRVEEALAAYDRAVSLKPDYAEAHAGRGAVLLQQKRLEEALEAYEQALQSRPDVPQLHRDRGRVLWRLARLGEALAAYEQALRLQPDYAEAHFARGVVLQQQGRLEEALAAYDGTVSLKPDRADAHFARGVVLQQQGRLEEALAAYDGAVSLKPDYAEAHAGRGAVLLHQKRLEEALEAYEQALQSRPDVPQLHRDRGRVLWRLARLGEALAAYEQALRLKPDYADAHFARGVVLQQQGRLGEALEAYERARRIKPDWAIAQINCGVMLEAHRRLDEALAAQDQALRLEPAHPVAHLNRAVALSLLGRAIEALAAFDEALRIKPDFAQAHANRGKILQDQGRFSEAEAAYQRALAVAPSYSAAYSNYLFCLNYDPDQSDAALAAAHRVWGERHGRHPNAFLAHRNSADHEKPLVVGLVSADLYRHPVGFFLRPLLASSNPDQLRFVCYSGRFLEDDLTGALRAHASAWRSTLGLSDRELAEAVRADGVDILIDLAGHTAGHRLSCFALRPAPVQIHWAGYCHSVPGMDYSLWDPIQVPDGDERWFVESVMRLPELRWCYGPPEYAPEVAEPPSVRREYITFGSFNNLTKVTPSVIRLWARVLDAVPHARLLLKWATLAEPETEAHYRRLIEDLGINPAQVELRGASSHGAMLAEYADIDIALDPFPFTGALTTCEALWMGVPVITLPRTRPVSRQSQAFLTALGRTEWVARDQDDYVHIATDLASDPVRLAALRRDQRALMAASPVCDGQRFARHFEAALRSIWQGWCARAKRKTTNVRA